jgi:hypothetical protein
LALQLEDFPHFQHRLDRIQQKVRDWRPQNLRQLSKQGYSEPLRYFTFITAMFFGTLDIFGLVAGII